METGAEFDPIKWLDKALINLSSHFGDFQNKAPTAFIYLPGYQYSHKLYFIFNILT